jgi:hypothetical protein
MPVLVFNIDNFIGVIIIFTLLIGMTLRMCGKTTFTFGLLSARTAIPKHDYVRGMRGFGENLDRRS